jgi:restriction system protein
MAYDLTITRIRAMSSARPISALLAGRENIVFLAEDPLVLDESPEEKKRRAERLHELILEAIAARKLDNDNASLDCIAVVEPEERSNEGLLVKAAAVAWREVVEALIKNWSLAYEISAQKWEEIIAGAFDKAGFDSVTLTPRSRDHGRDVIAIKNGVGSIKILDSVKAYSPDHLVEYDDVRSLLGVMAGERNASKGIVTTTSDFPPRMMDDPFIAPFVPYRLELMNGEKLKTWLKELVD